ncbi:Hypothetical protein GbCGDNIH6_0897 [Granulibacter bethesdensis]|nr:Hypothetical protein GbCGDNIH6_0897 [Granulibacter bethesdensis]
MYLKHKRRIFTSSIAHKRRPWRRWVMLGSMLSLGGIGCIAVFTPSLPSVSLLSLQNVLDQIRGSRMGTETQRDISLTASPAQVAVVDGETLRVADTVIRLAGVSAPNRGQQCRTPDGSRFDCGAASAEALAEIIKNRPVECEILGHDTNHHSLAICETQTEGRRTNQGTVINRAVVQAGWARAETHAEARAETLSAPLKTLGLTSDEEQARAAHRGLWRTYRPQF